MPLQVRGPPEGRWTVFAGQGLSGHSLSLPGSSLICPGAPGFRCAVGSCPRRACPQQKGEAPAWPALVCTRFLSGQFPGDGGEQGSACLGGALEQSPCGAESQWADSPVDPWGPWEPHRGKGGCCSCFSWGGGNRHDLMSSDLAPGVLACSSQWMKEGTRPAQHHRPILL